jgi:type II secretory pathway pseudopilin PulG
MLYNKDAVIRGRMIFMHRKGISLIEVVMVIVITGIIVAMTVPFISSLLDSWLLNKTERDILFSSRLAINRMTREIRQLKNVTSIYTFTGTEFDFSKIDNTRIDFKQTGNSLLLNSNELTDKLQSPGGLAFTYLDSGGNITSIKNNIRSVRIRLTLISGDSTITIESLARFRNI